MKSCRPNISDRMLLYGGRGIYFLLLLFQFSFFQSCAQRHELNKKDTAEVKWQWGKKFYVVKVEKGETLYSLSKRFDVPVEELIHYNPELKEGLKVKMTLLVPAFSKPAEVIKPAEPVILMPVKKSCKVALLLPFNYWKSFIPDTTQTDSSLAYSVNAESLSQIEFYEGMMHVADSLSTKDFRIHLYVHDNGNDTTRTLKLLNQPSLRDADYIVCNSSPGVLKQVSRYSAQQDIPLITFSLNSTDVLKGNEHAYSFVPSSTTQCRETGKKMAAAYMSSNAIIIWSGAKEYERAASFQSGWNSVSEMKARLIDYSKGGLQTVLNTLAKGRNNVLFIPSSNEDYVNSLLSQLRLHKEAYQLTIAGIPTWQYFESIEPSMLDALNVHIFTSSGLDRDAEDALRLRRYFRTEYMNEPSEQAYQGFDAMSFIIAMCRSEQQNMASREFRGVYASYLFARENGTNENTKVYLFRYKNYGLEEVK